MNSDTTPLSQQVAARYFEMWNTGDSSIAPQVLSPGWVDHAHPEVTGPHAVQRAVEQTRAAQPDLRFHIEAILGDGDLVAVAGTASREPQPNPAATRLIWLIRLEDGRMAEMWTYRDTSRYQHGFSTGSGNDGKQPALAGHPDTRAGRPTRR